jgi:hypothetical protein
VEYLNMSVNIDLMNRLKDLYPYGGHEDNKALAVHCSLVYDEFKKNQKWIKNLSKEALQYQGPYHLTALHLAAIKGNELAVQFFLSKGVEATQDKGGWTPLHHAVVYRQEKIKAYLLKSFPHLAQTKNNDQLTAQDLENKLIPPNPTTLTFRYRDPLLKEIVEKKGDFFKQQLGATLTDRNISFPDKIIKNWLNQCISASSPSPFLQDFIADVEDPSISINPLSQKFSELYLPFKKSPPSVYVTKLSRGEHGLFTQKTLPPYTLVADYLGQEMIPGRDYDENEKRYNFNEIHCKSIRSLGTLMQDGFPNVATISIIDPNTLSKITVIYTTCQILAHQQLLMHYGSNFPIKFRNHKEFGIDNLRQAFKTLSLKEHYTILLERLDNCKQHPQNEQAYLTFEQAKLQLAYLLHTPSALLTLIYEGIISTTDMIELLKIESKPQELNDLFSESHQIIDLLSTAIQKYEEAITKQSHLKPLVYSFLLSLLKDRHVKPACLITYWLVKKHSEEISQLNDPSVREKWLTRANKVNRLFEILNQDRSAKNTTKFIKNLSQLIRKLPKEIHQECLCMLGLNHTWNPDSQIFSISIS